MPGSRNNTRNKTGKAPDRPQSGGRNRRHKPKDDASESWQSHASWYNQKARSADSHQQQIILPGITALLAGQNKGKLLDVGCGPGTFSQEFARLGWQVTGIDIAEDMIEIAHSGARANSQSVRFLVDDATKLTRCRSKGPWQAAVSILQLMNVEKAELEIRAITKNLVDGGIFVAVILHPAFRIPRQSHWGWDEKQKTQYRRIDRYLSPLSIPITMHPGERHSAKTLTFHRPLSWYFNQMATAGLMIEQVEEWCSQRRANSGPRARAENRAAEEFPLFLAWRARKIG